MPVPNEALHRMAKKTKIRANSAAAPSLFIRVRFGERGFIGPGKVRLLELIERHGSISAAGRAMDMSYRRAWLIVEELNHTFAAPLVGKQTGGSGGGGAVLTELGKEVVARYRRIEHEAAERAAGDMKALWDRLAPPCAAAEEQGGLT